ncbi:ARM repeat-containing protein [Meredithblackwellia eburnea MCA 4105]
MESGEGPTELTTFSRLLEFNKDINKILSNDNADPPLDKAQQRANQDALNRLCSILDDYQEQSYLLDPHVEQLVNPVINALRDHVTQPDADLTTPRVKILARLLYFFTKVRGAKTILKIFPHQVSDLTTLTTLFSTPSTLQHTTWELRYVLLLWFSLVAMLPFPLGAGPTSHGALIEQVGFRYLAEPGKERDGAVGLLGRYYSRNDTSVSQLLSKCHEVFSTIPFNSILSSSLLQTLCSVLKLSSPSHLLPCWSDLYQLLSICENIFGKDEKGGGGAVMTRYRVKLAGRLAGLRLPPSGDQAQREEMEVPDEVEVIVQELLESTRHSDTIVRYSSAKYLARIASRLPASLSSQIVEALIDTFDEEGNIEVDEYETTLHGSCLALAEFARRGQLNLDEELVPKLIPCVLRALLFDHKLGVQSIGSSVRDAAAYVLWSLSRVLAPDQIRPWGKELASRLVATSLFDREIHIRRAASAAFQEGVGRWGVFPHGIELLRKIDFITVGIRKRAFLEAAPVVAELVEYRQVLVDHLMNTTIPHYDSEIRGLGAGALEKILRIDPVGLIPSLVESQINKLSSKETSKLHGALLALASIAAASETLPSEGGLAIKHKIIKAVTALSPSTLPLPSRNLLLSAALFAIEKSVTVESISTCPSWWTFFEVASKSQEESLHRRAAETMRRISVLGNCGAELDRLLAFLDSSATSQQSFAAVVLGAVDFSEGNADRLETVVDRTVRFCGSSQPGRASSIEGKRNGIEALSFILQNAHTRLTASRTKVILEVTFLAFSDYTVDQRGDVGSWVRMVSVQSVERVSFLFGQDEVDLAVSNLLKQAMERLDSLREMAGTTLERLAEKKMVRGGELKEQLKSSERGQWRLQPWVAERLLPFLGVPEYRTLLLEGVVLGLSPGSTNAVVDYASSLPSTPGSDQEYSLKSLVGDLNSLGKRNFSANRIFIPVLGALSTLLEAELLGDLGKEAEGLECLQQALNLSTKAIGQLKSAPRLTASVKVASQLLAIKKLAPFVAPKVLPFLGHSFPWLRQTTAEELFNVVSLWEGELEALEELVTLLSETSWTQPIQTLQPSIDRVGKLLLDVVSGL